MELYTLKALKIGNTVIQQVTDQSFEGGIEEMLAGGSGHVYNRDASVGFERPKISITTEMVKTALDTVGLTGVAIGSSTTVIAYIQQYADGGLRGTVDKAITITKGVVVLRRLSAQLGQLANVSLDVIPVSPDGTNAPFTFGTVSALSMGTGSAEMFTVSGSEGNGVQSLDIDFGVNVITKGGDGKAWDLIAAIDTIQPRVTVTEAAATTPGPSTKDSVELIDCESGGYRGSAPITFTFNQNVSHVSRISGKPQMYEHRITPTWDGTNAPIVITGV